MMQMTSPPARLDRWSRPIGVTGSAGLLAPWPIPQEAIIEGSPEVRGRILARDHGAVAGLWECEVGRIELAIEGDELLVVIAGRLVIQTGQGETLLLEAGDVACLPDGTDCVLTVMERCRCVFQASAPSR